MITILAIVGEMIWIVFGLHMISNISLIDGVVSTQNTSIFSILILARYKLIKVFRFGN